MKNFIRQLIILCLPLALPAQAEEPPASDAEVKRERCISMSRISSAEVIDDQTIAFRMAGRDVYLNELPRRCPGMRSNRTIGYRTHAGQLCNLDNVTIIDNIGGVRRGPSCGLGYFTLISDDELKALKAERRGGNASEDQDTGNDSPE